MDFKTSEFLLKKDILGISASDFLLQCIFNKPTFSGEVTEKVVFTDFQKEFFNLMFDVWLPNYKDSIKQISFKSKFSSNGYFGFRCIVIELDDHLVIQINTFDLEICSHEAYQRPYLIQEQGSFKANKTECLVYFQNPEKFFNERILNSLQ